MGQSSFTAALLRWFAQYGRELPWRGIGDPYGIWVSEIILQQTRIDQGTAYWHRFMERFPTVEALAAASEDEVLRLWQGLGYYSRARNMHAAARQIVEQGGFPHTIEGLRALKGVGDYTAAAVGSMAFGLPAAAVDGNVYRVLARHYGIDVPINTTCGKHTFEALARELLPEGEAGTFNQAMMDFGATWCTPRSPHCPDCPVAETCDALRTSRIDQLPVKEKKLKVRERRFSYIYIKHEGMTALRRRPAGDIWQGLWEPLFIENAPLPELGCPLTLLVSGVKHVLTHRILLADFYLAEPSARPDLPPEYVWIKEREIGDYALPRLVEKLLEILFALNNQIRN
ncbi:MAG: A/G-specific adenine glycosylase [Muribaculaceae bacterium]|nr:A/G-specific adenine glycosylase [Muribaculaceae bacterium]